MSNPLSKLDIDFQSALDDMVEERRVLPLIKAAERTGFKDFTVSVEGYRGGRGHDGWWHPSGHSTMNERQLFLYLAYPDEVVDEEFDVNSIEAVTSGKFWHEFIQTLLTNERNDVLTAVEVPVISAKYRIRGHIDGELAFDEYWGKELLEIKTINRYKFKKVTNEAELRAKNPDYYGQAQTYLALRFGIGVGRMRFVVIDPSYPFPKNEFTVEANPGWQAKRLATYENVWQLVQRHQAGERVELPSVCCGARGSCPAQFICPKGVAA